MIIRINNNNIDKDIINRAVSILDRGGILIMPTETAYGLAADATNKKGVERIYKIKGRSFNKFLPLIASSNGQIKKYFKVNSRENRLLVDYKGLSIVLSVDKKQLIEHRKIYLLKNQNSCAVRVSTYPIARMIAKKLDRPITATSANKAGGENCYELGDVWRQLKESDVDMIIDGGRLANKKPSTIVRVLDDKIEILRQGEVEIKH